MLVYIDFPALFFLKLGPENILNKQKYNFTFVVKLLV